MNLMGSVRILQRTSILPLVGQSSPLRGADVSPLEMQMMAKKRMRIGIIDLKTGPLKL